MAISRRFLSIPLRLTGAPVGTGDTVTWRAPFGCRITQIQAYRAGGTTGATVNAKIGAVNVLANALTAGNSVYTTGATTQSLASGAGSGKMVAGDVLSFSVLTSDSTTLLLQADIEVDKNVTEL